QLAQCCSPVPLLGRCSFRSHLPGLKSLQIEAACWSQGHFSKFLDRSRNLTCLALFGMSGLGNKELESLLGSIPALTRLTVRLKSMISAQMLQRLSNGLLLPRLQFLDMSLEHTVEARDALIGLVRVRSPPQGCLEEIVVRVTPLSESRKQQLHDKLECFPRTRYRILKPELMYFSFSEWMEEVHKSLPADVDLYTAEFLPRHSLLHFRGPILKASKEFRRQYHPLLLPAGQDVVSGPDSILRTYEHFLHLDENCAPHEPIPTGPAQMHSPGCPLDLLFIVSGTDLLVLFVNRLDPTLAPEIRCWRSGTSEITTSFLFGDIKSRLDPTSTL
ncbi:hypothetical protein C8J56DRAFT_1074040, partial [Mycena floridula]